MLAGHVPASPPRPPLACHASFSLMIEYWLVTIRACRGLDELPSKVSI